MTSEDSSGFGDGSLGQVRPAVGHDPPDYGAEFDGRSGDRGQVREALGFFAEPEVAQVAFLVAGPMGHGPEGVAQEGRAAFADVAARALVLAGLADHHVQAGEGDQLVRGGEGLEGIGFAEEADRADPADARQSQEVVG